MAPDNMDIVIDNALEPRKLYAKACVQWLRAAFNQFKTFPFIWIALTGMYIALTVLAMQSKLLSVMWFLLMPIVNGGLFIAAATADSGASPRIEHLFSAFKTNAIKLMIAGCFWGVFSALFNELFIYFVLSGLPESTSSAEQLAAYFQTLPATTLFWLGGWLWLFIYCSIVYAVVPGLILFNRLTPFLAYRFALIGCLRNWSAITLYILIIGSLASLASIPFFLGWVILFPLLIIANFYIWKSVFTVPSQQKNA